LLIELVALCVAAMFALVVAPMVSKDANVAFFVAIVGGLALWEGVRFLLLRQLASGKL
jgi:hypothetical protein